MSEAKISAYFITLNEASTIEQALTSVASLDEVIVVDSGSTDGTIEIAEKLGARVVHQTWLGFAQQKAFALELCRNEWCLNLDGDEVLPVETLQAIQSLVASDRCDVIRMPIEDVFMGDKMHPKSRKRSIIRVFKRSHVEYPLDRLVHENVKTTGRVASCRECILHYGYDSLSVFMSKQNKYAQLAAQSKFSRGKKPSRAKLALVFVFTFIKVFFFRRLFLSGARGLIQANIEAMYAFLKESYLYEARRLSKKDPL